MVPHDPGTHVGTTRVGLGTSTAATAFKGAALGKVRRCWEPPLPGGSLLSKGALVKGSQVTPVTLGPTALRGCAVGLMGLPMKREVMCGEAKRTLKKCVPAPPLTSH